MHRFRRTMLFRNSPDPTRLRRLITEVFTTRHVEQGSSTPSSQLLSDIPAKSPDCRHCGPSRLALGDAVSLLVHHRTPREAPEPRLKVAAWNSASYAIFARPRRAADRSRNNDRQHNVTESFGHVVRRSRRGRAVWPARRPNDRPPSMLRIHASILGSNRPTTVPGIPRRCSSGCGGSSRAASVQAAGNRGRRSRSD